MGGIRNNAAINMKNEFALRRSHNDFLLIPLNKTTNSEYYILNSISAFTWLKMESGENYNEICEAIANANRNIEKSIIYNDIDKTFKKLNAIQDGLVEKNINYDFFDKIRNNAKLHNIPIEGTLELTYQCNLKCKHCYCANISTQKNESTKQELLQLIDELYNAGCIWLLLSGGEVLLRKDFSDIYIYAKKKGFIITIFTNGLLINKNIVELFEQYPPHLLEISIYGASNETYHTTCGVRNGFDKITKSLQLLDEGEIKYCLKTFMLNSNKRDFESIKKMAESRGCRFRFDTSVIYDINQKRITNKEIMNHKDSVAFEISQSDGENLYARTKFSESNKLVYCSGGDITFNINPYGQLSMCSRKRTPSYDINKKNTFHVAWHQLTSEIRNFNNKKIPCATCSNIPYCKVCPAVIDLPAEQMEFEFCDYALARKKHQSSELTSVNIKNITKT